MDRRSDTESLCLEKLQREASICLNTFPAKVMELNNVIEKYTPEAMKKTHGETVTGQVAPNKSDRFAARDSYRSYREARGCCSGSTSGRMRSSNGISRRKHRLDCKGATVGRRSRHLARILTMLASSLAECTRAMVIEPSKYIMETLAATFLRRRQLLKNDQDSSALGSSSTKGDDKVVNELIRTMRPAAVKFIADTTILKRWLQTLALESTSQSPSLAQAIRTTESIDVWAYELFFHLKYLQVTSSPMDDKNEFSMTRDVKARPRNAEGGEMQFPVSSVDPDATGDVRRANLWHRLVQLRDNHLILYETLLETSES